MRPLEIMLPLVGGVILLSTLRSVDFPAPFLPIMPTESPGLTVKLMSFKAQKSSFLAEGFKKEKNASRKLK